MLKIYLYECRRLLWNKFFFGLLAVLLFYGWQVLTGTTILGVSHTAPFSPWSFGDYICRMLPLLWIGALFFLTFFISARARRTAVLTCATPMPPRLYALARSASALTGASLLSLSCLVEAAVFYMVYFDWLDLASLLSPFLSAIVPTMLFAIGSGWLLCRIRPYLIYAYMPLPFIIRLLPLPEALSLLNGSFFTEYPLTLSDLDPSFALPVTVILTQCIVLASGMVMIAALPVKSRKASDA